MAGVRTSIIGRPRPLPRHRRASDFYTLNCDEPVILMTGFRPGLIAGSSVKREGKPKAWLVARQISGWLGVLVACVLGIWYLRSLGARL